MKSIRQRLTYLINLINEKIPEDADVYGYEGISKDLILISLKESYDLLGNLEEYQEKFEVIYLHRSLSVLIDEARSGLKDGIFKSAESKFDAFLNCVQKIRYEIRETYVAVTEHPLRVDAELKLAKEQLEELMSDIEEISDIYAEIESIKETSENLLETLQEKDKAYKEQIDEIDLNKTEISETNSKVGLIAAKITEWQEEINSSTTAIAANKGKFDALLKEVESLKEKNERLNSSLENGIKLLETANEKNEEQQSMIQKTIEDANRAGMAGSFKKRKDELRWTLAFWQFFRHYPTKCVSHIWAC